MKTKTVNSFLKSVYRTRWYIERDGVQNKFFAGCMGIFGHGNVAGIGQALHQNPDFPYYVVRNEQGMVACCGGIFQSKKSVANLCLYNLYWSWSYQYDYGCCWSNYKSNPCFIITRRYFRNPTSGTRITTIRIVTKHKIFR